MAKEDPKRKPDDDDAPKAPEADDTQPSGPDESVIGGKTEPNLLDSTIDSLDDAGPNPLESTVESIGDMPPDGLSSTVDSIKDAGSKQLESTVESITPDRPARSKRMRPGAAQDELMKTASSIDETQQFETIDPFGMSMSAQKTIDDINHTIDEVSSANTHADLSSPSSVEDIEATQEMTVNGVQQQTIDLGAGFEVDATPPSDPETQVIGSALDSPDVGQTINPRELSRKDAEIWDSLAAGRTPTGRSTQVVPAIERSFTETKLQIRPRQVVTPKHDPKTPSDYRLVRLLGKGGMGNVFVAKQESLDRMIAVKVIKPLDKKKRAKLEQTGRLEEVEADRRHQFLSEAVVTGDLDHPNIVPIYDIAVTADESLFYAMKRVVGTPWSRVLHEKTLDENLDTLLKVCDAVGFAHTRGVVHRDIKPENIMLGDFGVVMVMDWGLALAKPDFEKIESIAHTAGLGGTPAFMAPEMATGPIEMIGAGSDIYLLGATLFQLITGSPPHQAENVSACIRAVTTNTIREIDPQYEGELMNIALKAMKTRPQERYADVPALQDAIREYRSHAESITLAARAREEFTQGQTNRDYRDFSRATFGFEEAIALWPGNQAAREGLAETRLVHAQAAYDNGDFDLGLSLLDREDQTHQPVIHQLEDGLRERDLRQSRLVLFKRAAAAMLAFILVGGAIALYAINYQRKEAKSAQLLAEKNEGIAKEQTTKAETALIAEAKAAEQERIAKQAAVVAADEARRSAQAEAEAAALARKAEQAARKAENDANVAAEAAKRARANAELARDNEKIAAEKERLAAAEARKQKQKAEENAQEAIAQKLKVEYEVYLSKIGLAKARIERNEFDDARRILDDLKRSRGTENLGWEWRWLYRQAHQSKPANKASSAAVDLAVNRAGSGGAAVLEDGSIELISLDADGHVTDQSNFSMPGHAEASAVAFSTQGEIVAVGTMGGEIEIWDASLNRRVARLVGHENRVTDVAFAPSGQLISGSADRTARIWDVSSGKELATCWHIAPVLQVGVPRSGSLSTFVTAVADSSTGRAVVWRLTGSSSKTKVERFGEFLEHARPVSSIAIAPRGDVVATGDAEGNILIWQPDDVRKTDYADAIKAAVRQISDRKKSPEKESKKTTRESTPSKRLIDDRDSATQLVSVQGQRPRPDVDRLRAHKDIVESIRFSDDGRRLLSTSDDYTMKLWDLRTQSLEKALRGHGGWVTDADFVAGSSEKILSISRDATIRAWDSSAYVGEVAMLTRKTDQEDAGSEASQAHADEIWSARFDPTGSRIVSASRDQTARILQIDPNNMTFREVARLRDAEAESTKLDEGTSFLAMSAAVDRAHQRLYVGSADSTVRIWDLTLGTEIGQANGTGLNNSLALSASGRLLLTGSSSTDVKAILWDLDPSGSASPRRRFPLRGHDQAVTAFAISPDGTRLFTGDRIGIGILWDATTGKELSRISEIRGFRINAADFSPDGEKLLIAADDQQLSLIDVKAGKRARQMRHDGFVTQLSLSADGGYALTVDEMRTREFFQSTATLWDLRTGKGRMLDQIKRRQGSAGTNQSSRGQRIDSARFGSQSRLAVISRSAEGELGEIRVYDVRQSAKKPTKFQLPATLGAAQVATPISSRELLTLNGDAAFLWDLQTMSHIKSYRSHAAVTGSSFSFDGRYVTTGSRSIKVWDAKTGLAVAKLENPHQGPVSAVQFSRQGPGYVLATAGIDRKQGANHGVARVWTWNPQTKAFKKMREFAVTKTGSDQNASPAAISSIAFSPDGRQLLTVGDRGTVRVWRLHDNQSTAFDIDQPVAFTCGAFSPDGKWIAAGSDDKLARMWKIPAANQAAEPPIIFEGHADRIEDIRILMDGSTQPRVLTASRDKSARVWDPRLNSDGDETTGREIVALRKHTQGVTAIDVTPSGNLLMTAGRDGGVILWPAEPFEPPEDLFQDLDK